MSQPGQGNGQIGVGDIRVCHAGGVRFESVPMKSMTGFGRGEASAGGISYRAEVSSVNRKQADIVVSLPRELAPLDPRVREKVGGAISRGRVNVNITTGVAEGAGGAVQVDTALALQYAEALDRLAEALGQPGLREGFDPMRAPGVIEVGEALPGPDDAWPAVEGALSGALGALVEMRAAEGEHLREDMAGKLSRLESLLGEISACAPGVVERYRDNLHKRLGTAGLEVDLDDERVLREIGLFADRCDISEEIARLGSHFAQCRAYFGSDEPVGRSLDFLAQEMGRELNTIGSKANDAGIAQRIVEAKTELEKIREQVQNVE